MIQFNLDPFCVSERSFPPAVMAKPGTLLPSLQAKLFRLAHDLIRVPSAV